MEVQEAVYRMEPPGVKLFEALHKMVVGIVRGVQEAENPGKAFETFWSKNGLEPVMMWMKEQRQKRHLNEITPPESFVDVDVGTGHLIADSGLSLQDDDVKLAIVTTASLPWMTGTAVNPLLRAAYLSRLKKQVTLLVPWLSPSDQKEVHPDGKVFESPKEQEAYVRSWLKNRVGFESDFKLRFYPGYYEREKGSIFAFGDITEYVPDGEAQVAVLEEPEHLNWYHVGRRWCDKFNHVVGIVHTNYLEYVRREEGQFKSNMLKLFNDWVVRAAGVHTVVKLSDAVQEFKNSENITCFVHGVSPKFLEVGRMVSERFSELESVKATFVSCITSSETSRESLAAEPSPLDENAFPGFDKGCYFLGKVLWGKGYSELLNLMQSCGRNVDVDVFGGGPDLQEVENEAERRHLRLHFRGAKDHGDVDFHRYKVFINPSMSDVVATTTAEALAMGKFVICADHPSNAFFRQFRNCLVYRNAAEFSNCLTKALSEEPAPLLPQELRDLSWEAATERFLLVAEPQREQQDRQMPKMLDDITAKAIWHTHQGLQHFEAYRVAIGAPPGTSSRMPDLNDVKRFEMRPAPRGPVFPDSSRDRLMFNLSSKVAKVCPRSPLLLRIVTVASSLVILRGAKDDYLVAHVRYPPRMEGLETENAQEPVQQKQDLTPQQQQQQQERL